MAIIKGKGTLMEMISGNRKAEFFTGGASDIWVQSLGYGPKWKSENQSSFGQDDPVVVDDTYDGISASFDVIETASKLVMATLTDQDIASAKEYDPSGFGESIIIANFKDNQSQATNPFLGSVLLKGLKVVAADTQSAVDGVQTKKFDFEGTGVVEYTLPIAVFVEAGDTLGTQVVDISGEAGGKDSMEQFGSDYARMVFAAGVQQAKGSGAGTYAETAGSVTINDTIAATDNIVIVYVYTPA